jgi:hypothetical protein
MNRFIPLLAMSVVLAVLPASASAKTKKSKQVLLEHPTGSCFGGATAGTATSGIALITVKAGVVSAKVTVKGFKPLTTYEMNVVQTPSGESCEKLPGETSLKTNSKGNGKAVWSEPIIPGQTGVFVDLLAPSLPDFLATKDVPLS